MRGSKESPARIEVPDKEAIGQYAKSIGKTIQPEWVEKLDLGGHGPQRHKGGGLTSRRTAEHNGHQIAITTTYEITIDGVPFKGHASVDSEGRIHCHAIPYETYTSAVGFIKNFSTSTLRVFRDAVPSRSSGVSHDSP